MSAVQARNIFSELKLTVALPRSQSLSGHVQKGTAVLHYEKSDRQGEGSFDTGALCCILIVLSYT